MVFRQGLYLLFSRVSSAFKILKQLRDQEMKKWVDARRPVKSKPQQPLGCEDFDKTGNEADARLCISVN